MEKDIKKEFPQLKGFSRTNLFGMKQFYEFYSTYLVHQASGVIENPLDLRSSLPSIEEFEAELGSICICFCFCFLIIGAIQLISVMISSMGSLFSFFSLKLYYNAPTNPHR